MLITARRISSLMFMVVAGVIVHRASQSLAAESPNERLALTTQRVVVFKDGYYLAIKHGTAVTNKEGELSLDDVPDAAVLGSMWATSAKGKLLGIVASRETVKKTIEKEAPCTQTLEVLQANIGKQARIVLHDKTIVQGKIRTVLAEPTASAPTPVLHDLFRSNDEPSTPKFDLSRFEWTRDPASSTTVSDVTVSGITGSQFILSGDEGDVLLSIGQIASLTIKDMKATLARTLTTTESPKRLKFRFAEPNQPVDLSLMYFRPGLRWIPTYRINLSPDEQKKIANLTMQAEFLNEAEDLDNVPVDIVVGVPNFRFRDTPSPLVLEATMRNVLQQAAPALMNQQILMGQGGGFSNGLFDARGGERRGRGGANAPAVEDGSLMLPAELGATGAQDLFIYSLPKLKLRKGQRAALPILTADVPYRDLYTWDLHDTRRDAAAASSGAGVKSPLQISENRVWHQLVLTNTTRVPWTTGAAMILQGTQPLGQDLLTYTSPGTDVRLPITVSVNTRGSFADEETDRKLNDLTMHGTHYARISKTATPTLSNRKAVSIDIEVTFRTGGKATEATQDGMITLKPHAPEDWIEYQGYTAVNNSSTVVWQAKLKPGESFAPSVKYHYFARH